MSSKFKCPACQTEYVLQPEFCAECGFPFKGTEQQKSAFIGQQILKKGTVSDTKDKIKRARIILWVIGGLNIIFSLLAYNGSQQQKDLIIASAILGLIFVAFGFLTYRKPFIAMLIPLLLLLLFYTYDAIQDPASIFMGILWKVIFITGLVYGLIGVIKAQRIRGESAYLKKQAYK